MSPKTDGMNCKPKEQPHTKLARARTVSFFLATDASEVEGIGTSEGDLLG